MDVIAARGALVRDPVTMSVIPEDGFSIDPTDLHWSRLLRDGDVIPKPKPKRVAKPRAARISATSTRKGS